MQLQAPLTPAALDYERPSSARLNRLLLRWFRIGVFGCLLVAGGYVAVTFRGWGSGPCLPAMLAVTGLCAALPGGVLLLGLPWRRYVLLVAMLLVIPAAVADGYGTLEEQLFLESVRTLPPTTPTVFKARRWWPNGNCYLSCDPATGQLDGDD